MKNASLHPQLERLYETGTLAAPDGTSVEAQAFIPRQECELICRQVEATSARSAVEVGMAHGASSVCLADALSRTSASPRLVSIDPFQSTDWKGIGSFQLEAAGFGDFCELIERPSHLALPELVERGERFTVALVDGWHTFDHCLLDFFYLDRLLEIGGVVIFDDAGWPAVNAVARFVAANRSYTLVDATPRTPFGRARGLGKDPLRRLAQIHHLRLFWRLDQSQAVAFRKDAEDARRWDHYRPSAP